MFERHVKLVKYLNRGPVWSVTAPRKPSPAPNQLPTTTQCLDSQLKKTVSLRKQRRSPSLGNMTASNRALRHKPARLAHPVSRRDFTKSERAATGGAAQRPSKMQGSKSGKGWR